jgi:hypothetical protein
MNARLKKAVAPVKNLWKSEKSEERREERREERNDRWQSPPLTG